MAFGPDRSPLWSQDPPIDFQGHDMPPVRLNVQTDSVVVLGTVGIGSRIFVSKTKR